MIIQASTKTYTVHMEKDIGFFAKLKLQKNTFFAIDRVIYDLYHEQLFSDIPLGKVFLIDAIETNKTIETALALCEVMTDIPAKRNAHLISMGGGIVQDITGFAANILYRGILWTYIPTTLLAACDSCIGGKTSLNYKKFKNLFGTFFPPDDIYIASDFFKTLSDRDFKSGLGEVVKFNIMSGPEGLTRIEQKIDALVARDQASLDKFVERSLSFKRPFIEADEFDRGVRVHLNFAHTFGHAFETVSNYFIPHGTAVAMGMLVANRISLKRGLLAEDIVTRTEAVLRKIIRQELVPDKIDMDQVINVIRKDKKQTSNDLTGVLLHDDMQLKIYRDLEPDEVAQAFRTVLDYLNPAED